MINPEEKIKEDFWPFEKSFINKNKDSISSYFENAKLGKEICAKSKVAVVSLARNCEKNLQKSINLIKKLECSNFKFFIYENDSIDKTKSILLSNPDIEVSLNTDHSVYLTDGSRERTTNLSRYRNVCLEWVKKNCSDFDYVIVLDLDPDLGFFINGIYNSINWLNKIPKAGGMGSYSVFIEKSKSIISHYDTFAMRSRKWYPSSPYRQEEQIFKNFHPRVGTMPISFYSCFGGLAVYKKDAFVTGKYNSSLGCEHVSFHKYMREKGHEMYLNPSSRFGAVSK